MATTGIQSEDTMAITDLRKALEELRRVGHRPREIQAVFDWVMNQLFKTDRSTADPHEPFAAGRCTWCGRWIAAFTYSEWSRAVRSGCSHCGLTDW